MTIDGSRATVTIPERLSTVAERDPDAVAITYEGESITRRELDLASNRLARAYAEMGVGRGDLVAIALPNSIEFYLAAIATWKLGASPQPLSHRMPAAEFAEVLALTPRALLVGADEGPNGERALPRGYVPRADLSDEALPRVVAPSWKVMASGGSTGRPKLIATTADSTIDLAAMAVQYRLLDDEVQLVTGPLAHNNSFMMSMLGLSVGHRLIVMSRFDTAEMLRLVTDCGVNFVATVPTVMQRALVAYREQPDVYDLSSLRLIWHGAAPCPPAVKQAWIDLIGADAVWEYYGGTEMQAGCFIGGHDWLMHPGSVGRIGIGRIRVLNPEGGECPAGEVGEFAMQSDKAGGSYRYIGSEPTQIDEGWDTLGDLGYVDDDGYFYISDRRVDMFNVGGAKCYPAEVEAALAAHPDILSSLVVGVPHADLGQVPYALVQVASSGLLSDSDVKAFARTRLIPYKVPRYVEFTTEPLRDEAGKARRSAVRDGIVARMFQPAGG